MRWAVILAGGSGSRFWPLSTPLAPKQLLPLAGPQSTAEATIDRLTGLVDRDRILLVTGRHLAGPLQDRLGLPPDNVLVEPAPKSTGPALAWATHEARRRDPDAAVLSLHADWHIPDPAGFRRDASRALDLAERGPWLVTVGVVPSRPDAGFGYLVPGPEVDGGFRVAEFKEKPSAELASRLIAAGAVWNSGLFAWRAETLLTQVAAVCPEMASALPHLDRGRVTDFFDGCREVSIDVGVLERSAAVAMVRGAFAWDDVGTWEALSRVRPNDAAGNVLVGDVTALDSANVVAWTDHTPVVLAGVRDLVVVAANGRILVLDRARAAALKSVLDRLPPRIREI
ncbi:MAG: mannose-1-phosphate guanylyltransferase [Gemmatimonadales bacterium]|nr:mannose-1-phosphate guanylyltransferase [Gemmatimonadales bacterium]